MSRSSSKLMMTVHHADSVSLINRFRNSGQTPTSFYSIRPATDGGEDVVAVPVRW